MNPTRSALIVANYDFQDPGLRRLRAPAHDAEALAEVLGDPEIGAFDVRTVLNQPSHLVDRAIEGFFSNRGVDDLLLLHFSGHGVKDESGDLYFAAADTDLGLLGSTAVSSDLVNRLMSRTRARRVVLLLDCCYAGAFARGMATRGDTSLHLGERLGGRGRAVITASTAMEYAFEGTEITDAAAAQPSVFTSALVEGLRSGEADSDQDGFVGLDELYEYVFDRVRRSTPNQTPSKWALGLQGELVIARRNGPATHPTPIPQALLEAVESPFVAVRRGAVQELTTMLQGNHEGRALTARQALEGLRDDDSRSVAEAAAAALAASPEPAATTGGGPLPQEVPRGGSGVTADPGSDWDSDPADPDPGSGSGQGGDSDDDAGSGSDDRPDTRRRTTLLLGAGGVVAALIIGLVLLPRLLADQPDPPGSPPAGAADDTPPTLAETTLVLDVDPGSGSRLMTVEAGASAHDLLGRTAYLPTISPDRSWIVYMTGPTTSSPFLVRADGTDARPLPIEETGCDGINRPSWSPDGERLAVVCKQGSPFLLLTDLDGAVQERIEAASLLRFSPTWGAVESDGEPAREVVVVAADNGSNTTQLLMFDPARPRGDPIPVPNGKHLDTNPDLDRDGLLLFLRQPPSQSQGPGEVWTAAWDGTQWHPEATGITGVRAPTWGTASGEIAYLKEGGLYTSHIDSPEDEREIQVDGEPGPPAWGSR